jgi:hypothetical protein
MPKPKLPGLGADQKPLESASNGYNVGAVCKLHRHNRLLFSAGRAVVEISPQNSFSTSIAYGLTW